jgi:DHA1 family inner membrane transport protein
VNATGTPAAPWRSVVALAGLTLGTFMFVTIETLPVGLLTPMVVDLHVSTSAIGLLVTCYALVVVVTSVPLTRLTSRVPRRRLLSVLLAGYVLTATATALADSWATELAARIGTAISQALFWSIVVPVAAGMFDDAVRGRVVAVVLSGSPLAAVAGVPLGTWVGQGVGWRWSFLALALLGALVLATVLFMPEAADGDRAVERGSRPDARRFWVLVTVTALATTGAFAFFTYVTAFLTEVAGVSAGALSLVLLGRGLAGVAGVATAGALTDRHPRLAVALPVGVQVMALAVLFTWSGVLPVAVAAAAVTGFSFAAFTAPMASRAMALAPGRLDLAISMVSTAVNIGISVGALLGSVVVAEWGPRATALVGAGLTAAALAGTAWDRPRRQSRPCAEAAGRPPSLTTGPSSPGSAAPSRLGTIALRVR